MDLVRQMFILELRYYRPGGCQLPLVPGISDTRGWDISSALEPLGTTPGPKSEPVL